jgi:uncharacterized protein DUF2252
VPVVTTRAERYAAGKALRNKVPRSSHAAWSAAPDRPDPVSLLEESNRTRLAELVPIRYGRMALSPFTFLRGSAGVMASDLATTPISGIRVQLCSNLCKAPVISSWVGDILREETATCASCET